MARSWLQDRASPIYKSQLLRAYSAFVTADCIRNPGCRPAYSFSLACPISRNSPMRAWLVPGCRTGLPPIYKSQLLRAYSAFVTADCIRNPGCRPAYSFSLACSISRNSPMRAWLVPGCRTGLPPIYKSQLLRAYSAFVTADCIRNPGCRPAYSFSLACPISRNSPMRAWLVPGCRTGLL